MREDWTAKSTCYYYFASFTFVFMMQGLFSLVNNSSVLFINLYSKTDDIAWTDFVGLAVWLLGYLIETLADAQLTSHLKNPRPGTGKFIKSGLWRYSRHPNYFGEAVMWWGLWIIACGIEYGWITVFSCAFITFLLRFVSGVPFPEKKYATNPEWMAYSKETNVFCLWPAKIDKNAENIMLEKQEIK